MGAAYVASKIGRGIAVVSRPAFVVVVVSLALLSCFQGASPAAAQEIALCSKHNPNFRQTGILKRLDERNYVLITPSGEQSFSRGDFVICAAPEPPQPLPMPTPAPTLPPAAECKSRQTLPIQGSSTIGLGVMPSLIRGFADVRFQRRDQRRGPAARRL
jgi:hypothetical protein